VRILIADDDPVSGRMLESLLVKWGYDVAVARDGCATWEIMRADNCPRMVILDWNMPGMDGIEVCRRIRGKALEPYIYVLMLTVRGSKKELVEGMEAGADDYVSKPFDPEELRVRLRAGRRMLDLQDHLIAARDNMRMKATQDLLTGLPNRAEILDALDKELARSRREGRAVSVVMADLDRFKAVNDTYGHMGGDAALRETAARFAKAVRSYDKVGRYGGEEFLFILPGCDAGNAARLAERVREALADEPINTAEGIIRLTVSLGVACAHDVPAPTVQALVGAADAALYEAKRLGRNRVARFPVNRAPDG